MPLSSSSSLLLFWLSIVPFYSSNLSGIRPLFSKYILSNFSLLFFPNHNLFFSLLLLSCEALSLFRFVSNYRPDWMANIRFEMKIRVIWSRHLWHVHCSWMNTWTLKHSFFLFYCELKRLRWKKYKKSRTVFLALFTQ